MSSITSPSYDPTSTATALAQKATSALQQSLTAQTSQAGAIDKGLISLNSDILAFQASLSALTSSNKALFAQSATFSDTTVGSASADATATPGTYSFYVEKLATASQVSYAGLQGNLGGSFQVNVGAAHFDITMSGTSPAARDLAAAINAAPQNTGLVSASVISTPDANGTPVYELVLTAKNTGAASAVSLSAPATGTQAAWLGASTKNTLVAAQDAIVHIGSAGGTAITQATNTFTNISGVKMTFARAQATATLTVAPDSAATATNVQSFITAYNRLKSALDAAVDPGDPSTSAAAGVFAHDAGVRALRDRLVGLVRPAGATSLASYGIIAARDGTLSVDTTRLNRQLALDPKGLDTLIGSSSASAPSGIANALDKFLKGWSSSANGQIQQRQSANAKLQKGLADRQAELDRQYDAAYQRYVVQFTKLQTLQGQMSSNVSMFDAMFSNNNDK